MANKDRYNKVYPKKREMTETEREFIYYFGSLFKSSFVKPVPETYPSIKKRSSTAK